MDAHSIHMALNHVPTVGAVGALLLLGWGLLRRSCDVTAAALTAFVVVALVAIPVFLTGSETAGSMAPFPGSDELVQHHRDTAVAALIGLEAAAMAALAALYAGRAKRRPAVFAATATLILGAFAAVLLVRTANLGGQLRHPELRSEPRTVVRTVP